MEIKMYHSDSVRLSTNGPKHHFIDVRGLDYNLGLAVDLYPAFHYIEIREKGGFVRVFLWENKGAKHTAEEDPNYKDKWWLDAKVIFAKNEVTVK